MPTKRKSLKAESLKKCMIFSEMLFMAPNLEKRSAVQCLALLFKCLQSAIT